MKDLLIYRRKDAELEITEGAAKVHRVIDETVSDEMGGGYFRVNGTSAPRVLPYSELCVVLEGTMRLTVGGETTELKTGDFACIPEGTEISFAGDEAVAFYAVHPVNWRDRA